MRLFLALLLGMAVCILTKNTYKQPPADLIAVSGNASVTFSNISYSKKNFGYMWTYKGTLHSFTLGKTASNKSQEIAKNLPITLSFAPMPNGDRPLAGTYNITEARLKKDRSGRPILSLTKNSLWEPVKNKGSSAEWRWSAKHFLQQFIASTIKDPHAASFLAGIATGEFDDRQLEVTLGRFGLKHLMAISGLHFTILASILGVLMHVFFPNKISTMIVIFLLSAYFLFLGFSPSVIRAWISIVIALVGVLIAKRCKGLNALGAALLIMALLDPFAAGQIGFQFSFAVTAAILIWFSPCEQMCGYLFAKRKLRDIVEMDPLSQHGICLLHFFKQALSLSLAVNVAALPLTLFHFHQFPLISLLYNLFFPFLMSFSMLLLVLGILSSLTLPWIASWLHTINEGFTRFMLDIAFNLPPSYDISIRSADFSAELMILYLLVTSSIGLFLKYKAEKNLQADICY